MQFGSGPRQTPAGPHSGAFIESGVHRRQFAGEKFVIVAKLQQLGVGIFQQLDGGFRAYRAVAARLGEETNVITICKTILSGTAPGQIRDQASGFASAPLRDLFEEARANKTNCRTN